MVVKAIRVNRTGAYDQLLSEEAKELVAQNIIDPLWYSFDFFKECFDAECQVDAKNDPKVILQWGREGGKALLKEIAKQGGSDANLKTALDNYTRYHRSLFNFGEIEGTIVSDHEVHLAYNHFDPEWVNFFYMATGWQQEFFHLCIGKNVTYRILQRPMKGAEVTQISLTWD
ncbi:MAG: hypothetical protein RBG13Loki_3173 [Promethearchaeota archaeon CR_4]|nr:MAG: hypothetical protein RBG13Loki_3173 [Candidatus Lokiarchaeota archaeon CR_4]